MTGVNFPELHRIKSDGVCHMLASVVSKFDILYNFNQCFKEPCNHCIPILSKVRNSIWCLADCELNVIEIY